MAHRILVTGGLGYVGSRLIQRLLQEPEVEVLASSRQRALPVGSGLAANRVSLIPAASLAGPGPVIPEGVQSIIHLAAYNEMDSARDPIGAAQFNIIDALGLLEAGIKTGVRNFIYFSTAHVYGSPLEGTIDESLLPRPIHPYAITHRAFEDFVLAAHAQRRINGVVLRLSNSFGSPVWPDVNRWTLLVNDLCREAVTRGTLTLQTPGLQERDFICLEDVVEAAWHFLQPGAPDSLDGLFNLGGNLTMTVRNMAALIASRCAMTLSLFPELRIPAPSDDLPKKTNPLVFSSEKLRRTGFAWKGDAGREIDQLLRFCKTHFSS